MTNKCYHAIQRYRVTVIDYDTKLLPAGWSAQHADRASWLTRPARPPKIEIIKPTLIKNIRLPSTTKPIGLAIHIGQIR